MTPIPVYLNSTVGQQQPDESEYYLIARNGPHLCRRHPFFTSVVPVADFPPSLAMQQPKCVLDFPRVRRTMLEYIVGFFDAVFRRYQSEAIVLLYWDRRRERYKLRIPEQVATVWETPTGNRMPMDVTYQVPLDVPPHHLLIGDIHSHGNLAAGASGVDERDETYRDGLHAIVGKVDKEPPDFSLAFCVDGFRFVARLEHFFDGYDRRRRTIPAAWLDRIKIVVERAAARSGSQANSIINVDWRA